MAGAVGKMGRAMVVGRIGALGLGRLSAASAICESGLAFSRASRSSGVSARLRKGLRGTVSLVVLNWGEALFRSGSGPGTFSALPGAAALFDVVRKGKVRVEIRQRYPLRDAACAHRDLEARATMGSSVLLP